MRTRAVLFALSVCLFPPAPAQELSVGSDLPAAFKLDGSVGEWAGTPSQLELGPASQVAGKSRADAPSDFSARVWLVFAREGIVLAAAVTDDSVVWPSGAAEVLKRDHAELWIAFPEASMPPLAYATPETGDVELPNEKACETDEEITDKEACREWVLRQKKWRRVLSRFFVRQYLISSAGVQETWFSQAPPSPRPDDIPFAWPEPGKSSVARVVPRPGGYSLEALIPLSDLPPLAQDPLTSFRALVDFADCDAPSGPVGSFFSSAARRKFGDVTTYTSVRLARPRLFESRPPLVAPAFSKETVPFFFPADPVTTLYDFDNRIRGPGVPFDYDSPTIEEMKLPEKPLHNVYGFDLYLAPVGIGISNGPVSRLVSMRDGKAVASYEFQSSCGEDEVSEVLEKDLKSCRLLAFLCTGVVNPWGYGMCGACPTAAYEIVAIEANGRVRFIADGRDEEDITCRMGLLELERLPADDAFFGWRCLPDPDLYGEGDEKPEAEEWKIPWSRFDGACR